jgi:hypothetical protein
MIGKNSSELEQLFEEVQGRVDRDEKPPTLN